MSHQSQGGTPLVSESGPAVGSAVNEGVGVEVGGVAVCGTPGTMTVDRCSGAVLVGLVDEVRFGVGVRVRVVPADGAVAPGELSPEAEVEGVGLVGATSVRVGVTSDRVAGGRSDAPDGGLVVVTVRDTLGDETDPSPPQAAANSTTRPMTAARGTSDGATPRT